MLSHIFVVYLAIIAFPVFAVKALSTPAAQDTLFLRGGLIIPVYISSVDTGLVYYTPVESDTTVEITRDQVEKIIYAGGRTEIINLPVFRIISDDSWRHIFLTENLEDVVGLHEIGPVQVTAVSDRSRAATLRNAEVRLKREAASIDADIILVTNTEFRGGYGDIPSITMKGVAYGSRPALH